MDLNHSDPCSREVLDHNNNSSSSVQDFLDSNVHQDPVEDLVLWVQDLLVDPVDVSLDLEVQEEVLEWVLVWDLVWALNDLDLVDLVGHVEMVHEDLQVAVPILE